MDKGIMKEQLKNLLNPRLWEMPEEDMKRERLRIMANAKQKDDDVIHGLAIKKDGANGANGDSGMTELRNDGMRVKSYE